MLRLGIWLQFLNSVHEPLRFRSGLEGRCLSGEAFTRDALDYDRNADSQYGAQVFGIRPVLLQQQIQKDYIRGDLLELRNARIVGSLGRSNQEAEYKRGDGADEAAAEPHHILHVVPQMVG